MSQPTDAMLHPRVVVDRSTLPTAVPAATNVAAPHPLVLSLHDNLASVEGAWRRFEGEANCTAFQTFAWHAAWQKHVGDPAGVCPAIVVGREGDRIAFIMPFAVEQGRLIRRLVWHASDLCDYNAPLLARDFGSIADGPAFVTLYAEVCRLIAAHPRLGYDAITLTKMPETVVGQPNPFMAINTTLNPNGAYVTTLFGDWETFYAEKRSSSTRRRDRTKRKRLADLGEVRFVTPDDPAEIASTLATLMAQKTKAFARMGVPDIFARPGYRDFFYDLATTPNGRGLAHVSRLDVGGSAAAVNFGLVFGGAYYHVLASYDDGPASRFGPGAAHLHELMRYAMEHGCGAFDFTIGDERYKREWSDVTLRLYDHRCAVTLAGSVATLPSTAVARAKRFIKQTPVLWELASRVRSLIGSLRRKRSDKPATADDASDET